VIKDHLDLKERNSTLDGRMPIDRYRNEDPFENHPLFKTEEQARIEETMDGFQPDFAGHVTIVGDHSLPWPGEETAENAAAAVIDDSESNGFWSVDRARDFDWGD
jgi:hypothetical protein